MDTLMAKAQEIPWISRVQVYSKDGYVAFGDETDEDIPEDRLLELLQTHQESYQFEETTRRLRLFIPLRNEDRCQVCHGSRFPMRGMIVIDFNGILALQASIVRRHGGDIDKYVGDELVAVFLGEKMAERAIRAAMEIQETLLTSPHLTQDGAIGIGIGINTGGMVMGAMGSPDRMDYTVIGDNVNLGARLCSVAKPGQILISESTAKEVRASTAFILQALEPMTVKGKEKPISVDEVDWRGAKESLAT